MESLSGLRIRIRTDKFDSGIVYVDRAEMRGEQLWIDCLNGLSFAIPIPCTIDVEKAVGTFDMATATEQMKQIAQARGQYGPTEPEKAAGCNCGRCVLPDRPSTGRCADGTPIDDQGIVPEGGWLDGF